MNINLLFVVTVRGNNNTGKEEKRPHHARRP